MYKLESITKKLKIVSNKADTVPVYTYKLTDAGTKVAIVTEREMFEQKDIGKEVTLE